ncbi:MAG: helix-turn-helix transcriptional regulator [Spirochaetia bacterium]|nr:helix-turn-helix transcriptional regulator [Spirochaetia bacterium]
MDLSSIYGFYAVLFFINAVVQAVLFTYKKKAFHFWALIFLIENCYNAFHYYLFYSHQLILHASLAMVFFDVNSLCWPAMAFMILSLLHNDFRPNRVWLALYTPAILGEIRLFFLRNDPVFMQGFLHSYYKKTSILQTSDKLLNALIYCYMLLILGYFIYHVYQGLNWRQIRIDFKKGGVVRQISYMMISVGSFDLVLFLLGIYYEFFHDHTFIFDLINLGYLTKGFLVSIFLQIAHFFLPYTTRSKNISDSYLKTLIKNPLNGIDKGYLEAQISKALEQDEIYLDENLTLRTFSERVLHHPSVVSYYLNREKGIRFNDLLADYRINKAIELMQQQPNLNITRIGYEAGFNSVSSFYRLFKKKIGISPDLYRSNLNL